jgi:transcriptional regulator GlxA family with amidase domain
VVSSVNENQRSLTVGILIFEQVEVLDVAGPFEVFSVTRLNREHRWEESSPFRVLLVSERVDQVLVYGGLRLTPDVTTDTLVEPIFTSAGVSAGIDLALRIVNHFFGIEIALATARRRKDS